MQVGIFDKNIERMLPFLCILHIDANTKEKLQNAKKIFKKARIFKGKVPRLKN